MNLPTYCDGCGKNFSVPNDLSCPKGGLDLARHNDAAKEWGALSARAINPSAISYKPKIKSRTVQVERNGAGAQVVTREQDGGRRTARRARQDRQRCIMSHRRMYLSMASRSGAPPLSLTCESSIYMWDPTCVRRFQRPCQRKRTSTSSPVWSVGVLSLLWCTPRMELPEQRP